MPAPAVIALVAAAMLVGMRVGPGVRASFVSQSTSTTGTLSFARLTGSFATGTDDVGAAGGVGGASYVMTVSGLALAFSTHRYTSLTNTGSVTAAFTGSVSGTATSGTMTVRVDSCTVAWASGACSGTTTVLLAATALASSPSVSYGSLAVNGASNLRYTFTSTSALAGATVTAAATPNAPAPGNDRTAG